MDGGGTAAEMWRPANSGVPWLLCADLCGAGAPSASFLREEFPTRGIGLLAQVTGQSHGAVRQE